MLRKKFGFNVRSIVAFVMGKTLMTVLAEEGTDPKDPKPKEDPKDPKEGDKGTGTEPTEPNKGDEPKPQEVDISDMVSKARQQEKNKLYPKIKTLEDEVVKLTGEKGDLEDTVKAQKKQIEDLQKDLQAEKDKVGKTDNENIKTLQKEVNSWKKKYEELEKDTPKIEAIEQKLKEEYEVKLYREQVLRETSEQGVGIIPELVTGTTKEEIDNTLEQSKSRWTQITQTVVKKSTHKLPAANPSSKAYDLSNMTEEEIRDMSPKDWAERRKQLGLK
jgi:chromosome segregation ATPase